MHLACQSKSNSQPNCKTLFCKYLEKFHRFMAYSRVAKASVIVVNSLIRTFAYALCFDDLPAVCLVYDLVRKHQMKDGDFRFSEKVGLSPFVFCYPGQNE